jgi:prepilin-type N-terminal cleavage/methylation domain-containing protein
MSFSSRPKSRRAFTLIELLMVIAVIGILAALLFPVLQVAQARSQRTTCLNSLKQINAGIQMYAEDNRGTLPAATDVTGATITINHWGIFYKRLMKSYLGLQGASSPQDKVFACPADAFYYDFPSLAYESQSYHDQPDSDYSSYGFNGANGSPYNPYAPGVFGWKQTSIKDPSRTLLVSEISAWFPWSWHQPLRLPAGKYGVNNAKNMVGFVDGHISYIEIYWNSNLDTTQTTYDPPAGYNYKKSPD